MQGIRVHMGQWAWKFLARGLTIAIRYGIVRRQFPMALGGPEKQILDYQTHQFKLGALLSQCYGMVCVTHQMMRDFDDMNAAIKNGDLSMINPMHALSSGIKVVFTTLAY